MKARYLVQTLLAIPALILFSVFNNAYAEEIRMSKAEIEDLVHDYLVAHPEVLMEASKSLEKQAIWKALNENAKPLFFSKTSPVAGNPKGNVSVIEFFDYQCPYCRVMTPIISEAVKKDKNTRLVFKELPIFGGVSVYAAKAALAAGKQGQYEAFHEALMAKKTKGLQEKDVLDAAKALKLNIKKLKKDMESSDITSELNQNMQLAENLQVQATPAMVINSTPVQTANGEVKLAPGKTPILSLGVMSQEELQQAIIKVRA